ncbi:MAG TPA: right-handed parallel beta-helix repeat-containing protein [Thermoleophilaceae bacterium]|nr:right-handed parallel beta-helix repeat-containing protein [Thermoleophilaceae bacterium]
MGNQNGWRSRWRALLAALAVLAIAVAARTTASAHIERASYWPDPAPDTSVHPPTGSHVPAARSLYRALRKSPPGSTRVVCKGRVPSPKRVRRLTRRFRAARRRHASERRLAGLRRKLKVAKRRYKRGVRRSASIRRLRKAITKARTRGYKYRPTEKTRHLSKRGGKRLLRFNEKLLERCKYHEIQPAANRTRNNDRIVIMPGIYTEPTSRSKPDLDPACKKYEILNDRGQTAALSYAYQYYCPNAQNLVAVIGRRPGSGSDPKEPRADRHGIPNLGPCIRCNVQLEGSGPSPDDVIVDAGRVASGNHGPIGHDKDVGIRADRTDGFVLRNVTVRHAGEHDIYILEADGYRAERFKTYYAGEYGVLTFVEDHGLMQDCDSAGHGDSALYPGSSAETGQQRTEGKYRYSQEIRRCDMRHSAAGYSGTDANAVWVNHNNIYDNALGFTTDVFTAAGHPGYPQDSDLVEKNNFYSNNFNPYLKGSDVEPSIPVPVGTGLWIAGGNNNTIRNNHFYDNWRRGTMIFTVPDSFVCGDNPIAGGNHQAGCNENGGLSTSYDNKTYGNVMGRDPKGRRDPNGTDFWWDSFVNQQNHNPPTTTGNCWYDNAGKDGTKSSITSVPAPPMLPSNCNASLGMGGAAQTAELLGCFSSFDQGVGDCDWFTTPSEPK